MPAVRVGDFLTVCIVEDYEPPARHRQHRSLPGPPGWTPAWLEVHVCTPVHKQGVII